VLSRFRRKDVAREAADRLHAAIAARARDPIFHTEFAVPDTIDGRFDLLALHAFLVMEALKGHGEAGSAVSTHLATGVFAGFEDALRDLGVGDFGLSRRIKAMAGAFYGRLEAYGVAEDEPAMAEAILRNVYRGDDAATASAGALARYAARARAAVASGDTLGGVADFGPLPQGSHP
jgi:cytochrome b pre-mRNA-processing protein 3